MPSSFLPHLTPEPLPEPEPAKPRRRFVAPLVIIGGASVIAGIAIANQQTPTDSSSAPAATSTAATSAAIETRAPVYTPPAAPRTTRATLSPTTSASRTLDADTVFLTILESKGLIEGDRATMLTFGHMVCDYLEQGIGNVYDAGIIAVQSGYSGTEAGALVGAAVGAFCPEYQSQF
jgi:hypothetical protein